MDKGDDVTATNITNISKKLTLFMSSTMFVKLLNRIIKQLNANISVLRSHACDRRINGSWLKSSQ